jgi:hypothetical protein
MSRVEIADKFARLAATVASPQRLAALAGCVMGLPEAADLATYADLLGRPAGS